MQYNLAYDYIIDHLKKNLPSKVTYHTTEHTLDVISSCITIAEQENVSGDDLTLLKTAALVHDIGYIESHLNHEILGCEAICKILPQFEYSQPQIDAICELVMATKIPQSPKNLLAKILCDADLFYLGAKDYKQKADLIKAEFTSYGLIKTDKDWVLLQKQFLTDHEYFTETAIKMQTEIKRENLEVINVQANTITDKKPQHSKSIIEILLTLIGVFLAAFALKKFLVPNHFFDGGITGLSLLIHEIYHFNLAAVIILLNIPLIAVGYFTVSKKFAIKTLIAVFLLGFFLLILPSEALTNDKLLVSIFGGVFLGIGIGLVMRTGAALDGIEVLALYTLKRTSFKISEIILGLNILIFLIAAFYFGLETSLYSILTYFAASRSIDYVVEGIQSYTGVTIISSKSEAVKYKLVNELGRGITIYKGERGFLPGSFAVSEDCDIIFTVITRLELRKLSNIVSETDPKAFVFANTIREASGGVLKKIHSH
jgi:uncharacterized membrane-anchored protein YitT (DUF2179 family)/HD superfamily phosphodiesterase